MITMEELERRVKAAPSMTAAELDALLYSCPEWVAQQEENKRKRQALAEEYDRDIAPVMKDLAEVGIKFPDLDELMEFSDPYPEAFPVLLRHLKKDHPPRIRESIVAALGVSYAHGEPARAVLEEFRHSSNEHRDVRFRMADTLEVTADKSMVEELEQLASIERDDGIAGMLAMAAKSAKKRKPVA